MKGNHYETAAFSGFGWGPITGAFARERTLTQRILMQSAGGHAAGGADRGAEQKSVPRAPLQRKEEK